MIRRRLAAAAVRVCPPELRAGREAELLGTALDAGEASRRAFAVQLGSLLVVGLGARCRGALTQPSRHVLADAVEWAAVVSLAIPLLLFFADELQRGGVGGSLSTVLIGYVVPVLTLALFTVGRRRAAGAVGCAWALVHLWVGFGNMWVEFPAGLRSALLPAMGFAFMTLRSPAQERAPRSTRWLWIVPAATFALMSFVSRPGLMEPRLAAPLLIALFPLPLCPAFALGTALMWAYEGAWLAIDTAGLTTARSIVLLTLFSGLPLAVLLASLGRRLVRAR